jgi:RNA polymerase sigma-70 factor (ECF subfamily)
VLEDVRRGRGRAWEDLYARFRKSSLAFCMAVLRDADLAEDALQESFLEASRKIGELRFTEAFSVWFRRILIKQCDRIQRGERPVDSLDLLQAETEAGRRLRSTDPGDQPFARFERREILSLIREAMEALPEPERSLCRAYYLEERDQREISRHTGLPLHTIKNRLFHARRILRRQLAGYHPHGPMAMAA